LSEGELLLVMDFKENLALDCGIQEVNRQFYNKPQRSFFGLVACYRDKNEEPLKKSHFDFVSNVLTHDTLYVTECLDKFFGSDLFTKRNFKKVFFWFDNGPHHFRTHELTAYFFRLKPRLNLDRLQWNFFVEYHGKNFCDSHFSLVSRFLRDGLRKESLTLKTEQELVTFLEAAVKSSNELKARRLSLRKKPLPEGFNTEPLDVKFFLYTREVTPQTKPQMVMAGFKSFYTFEIKNGTVTASVLQEEGSPRVEYDKPLIEVKRTITTPKVGTQVPKEKELHEQVFNSVLTKKLTREKIIKLYEERKRKLQRTSSKSKFFFLSFFNFNFFSNFVFFNSFNNFKKENFRRSFSSKK
jgi:hypothetical protein